MIVWRPVAATRLEGGGWVDCNGRLDVRAVRAFVRDAATGALSDQARGVDLGDMDLLVSELVTNALRYSASGLPGGGVSVQVLTSSDGLRVEIEDDGGATTRPHVRPMAVDGENWEENGRGLVTVEALANNWGHVVTEGRVTVWFELF